MFTLLLKKMRYISRRDWLFPLLLVCGYYCLYLFLRERFPFTPDFSGTDVFHFNVSYKYHMWKSIRSGVIPFWTDLLDGGFPLMAESQVGVFSLPYYLFFPFFSSFSHAYAFLFSFHLFLFSIGMYLLLRGFKILPALSFLLSIIFAWNGSIMFRWVHLTVLQSFSFTPLLFWLYFKWNESHKISYLFYISLVVNQMIFAGYIQSVFIALLGLTLFYVAHQWPLQRKKTFLLACSIAFGIILSLPQILPTLQLSRYSNRTISNSYDFATSVPFALRNVCSFFSPDCLGSPLNATYSSNWQKDGIYWENSPYIGELFVILLLLSSIYFLWKSKMHRLTAISLFLFFLFLLLALGKSSPLYFIFSIFPFTMFRTPARYLLMAVFFLILYTSFILNELIKKRGYILFIVYVALILNCILLIRVAFKYHLFIDSSVLFKSLSTQSLIKPGSLYTTYGATRQWQDIFLNKGWNTKKSIREYLFINQALLPNSNLISGISSFDIYTSMGIRRHQFLKLIINEGISRATHPTIESSQSARLENILQLYNISSIISFRPLYLPHFKQVQVMKEGNISLMTYQRQTNARFLDYYIPQTVTKVSNLDELEKSVYTDGLTENKSIAESIQSGIMQGHTTVNWRINKKEDEYMNVTATSLKDIFIVLRKNWYPEWHLYIDGKDQTFYKTNVIHMGFILPQGKHTIELRYVPTSFYLGCALSLLAVLIVLVVSLKAFKGRK